MSRPRWYTLPPAWGGLSLPWHRRLYLEWLYRRHGEAGLWAYGRRRLGRVLKRLELGNHRARLATDRCNAAVRELAGAMAESRAAVEPGANR